ncbi:acyl-CoA dehydrogenase [Pseudonocardiaceae bacterium YIM PH 21723]|nr:acyl-CoA dehydrogenase [Pseudonocardiaceae bacterium YIM PH 21723]
MTRHVHLTDEQQDLLDSTQVLARDILAPIAEQGTPGTVNRPLLRALAEHGPLRTVFGDEGVSAMQLCLLREALAVHCTEAETALAVQGLGSFPILTAAAPHLREQWIPRVAAGEAVAGFALTEPSAGSDVANLELKATKDGDGYRLTGTKIYISNAPDADIYSVFARTGDPGFRGITAFAVPRDLPGLTGRALQLVSPHPIGTLDFQDVHVPADHVLGEPGGGWDVAMKTLNLFRPSVGAFAIGMAQAALDAAIEHTRTRQAFGKPLAGFQGVSHPLADIATQLHAARLLVHNAATAYDTGADTIAQLSAMAKLLATETAQRAVDLAIQVHGAKALEQGHLLEHLYREVRAPRIYEGASEIQREIIARALYKN